MKYAGIVIMLMVMAGAAQGVRIKDVTHVEGVRDNQLIGYGLVVGLKGTGDGSSAQFPVASLASYLRRTGITIDPNMVKVKNVAAVVVTADLPAFARTGQRIDVTVSSVGDAGSLQGGTLLMTPLEGPDRQVYAVSQGPVSVGGFSAGASGSSATKNHPTAGTIPGGALVEKTPPTTLEGRDQLTLILDNPDFTTAQRICEVINLEIQGASARAVDSSSVAIQVPRPAQNDLAAFMASIEGLPIHPDQRARVVIDERTGTVVMGEEVRIATLALAHGNLSIQISQTNRVSQPAPFSRGVTTPVRNAQVDVQEEDNALRMVPEGVSLGEVVQSLNAIGVTPRDLISILQAIKSAGALQAELVIR